METEAAASGDSAPRDLSAAARTRASGSSIHSRRSWRGRSPGKLAMSTASLRRTLQSSVGPDPGEEKPETVRVLTGESFERENPNPRARVADAIDERLDCGLASEHGERPQDLRLHVPRVGLEMTQEIGHELHRPDPRRRSNRLDADLLARVEHQRIEDAVGRARGSDSRVLARRRDAGPGPGSPRRRDGEAPPGRLRADSPSRPRATRRNAAWLLRSRRRSRRERSSGNRPRANRPPLTSGRGRVTEESESSSDHS